MNEQHQTQHFDSESYRYVSSYISNGVRTDNSIPNSIEEKRVSSILDVGCGNGEFLADWHARLSAKNSVGVEPSQEGVKLLQKKWNENKQLSFQSAFAHQLPFETDSFDLVTTWSVLHWIGRNEYLQSIGELIRVCKHYLCIMDFVAGEDYRVPYHHKPGLFTYKQDFDPIIRASGIMKPVEKIQWWVDPISKQEITLSQQELHKFKGNPVSYHSRQLVVYEKNYDQLPIMREADFC